MKLAMETDRAGSDGEKGWTAGALRLVQVEVAVAADGVKVKAVVLDRTLTAAPDQVETLELAGRVYPLWCKSTGNTDRML
jgi:hypothetical protein